MTNNEKLNKQKNCKFFHHEPYMTPNNYDIEFDYAQIPANIEIESTIDLRKRLQRTLPTSKIIHLKLQSKKDTQYNEININTITRLKFTQETLMDNNTISKKDMVVQLK